ncbi:MULTISPECIES: hypothetical protein [unclassified Desulfovibrio]|uniref:hypothetical protein n=1 Tax=unclassified Desulfovibrio TaxID=2593640 RepID=UPI0013EDC780|nr:MULTISPECIES: hypothetical protein [unclassified Desulfovibrio]
MAAQPVVDVALHIFGKPYQTALCLASLMRHMGDKLRTVFYVMEPSRPKFDTLGPETLVDFVPRMHSCMVPEWLVTRPLEPGRLREDAYRHSLRYQYAWESSDADCLFTVHNDMEFRGDVLTPLLEALPGHVAVGPLGQCWNCPAAREDIVKACGVNGGKPCRPGAYGEFRCSAADLQALYRKARAMGMRLRVEGRTQFGPEYERRPWPLPECRVNEWCCLIDLRKARAATVPEGHGRPFGCYLPFQDMGVAWFRDVHHQGMKARHVPLPPFVLHRGGHQALFDEGAYRAAEADAAAILARDYPEHRAELAKRGFVLPAG